MNCMKCGRETPWEQAFCEECLLEMEKYPVRPGTVVQLPHRREAAPLKKTSKRRILSLEEQVKALKRRVTMLTVLLAVSLCLLGVVGYFASDFYSQSHFKVGQNYTSVSNINMPEENADTLNP